MSGEKSGTEHENEPGSKKEFFGKVTPIELSRVSLSSAKIRELKADLGRRIEIWNKAILNLDIRLRMESTRASVQPNGDVKIIIMAYFTDTGEKDSAGIILPIPSENWSLDDKSLENAEKIFSDSD